MDSTSRRGFARRNTVLFLATFLIAALAAFAQNPTATVTGKVSDGDGNSLPGVQVTATSEALQGERVAVTDANGTFKLGFLPAGLYELSYQLDGFSTAIKEVQANAGQAERVDNVTLGLSEISETITVTGNLENVSLEGAQATTIGHEELELLPVAQNIVEAIDLVPGVHRTGPARSGSREGNIQIAGSMSFENLYTVNGVVINENLRGQPLDLFIEDAIAEQTVTSGNVSAEFGRFTGGVVNVLTKSGQNQLKGTLRANLTNQDWESATRFTAQQEDKIADTYQATLGGSIIQDKLWFFAAARDVDRNRAETTSRTFLSFQEERLQRRMEGKLTAALAPGHNLVGTYLDIEDETNGDTFGEVIALSALSNRKDPQEIWAVNYNGALSNKWFVEAQYSERELFNGVGSGGPRDLYAGSSWETVIDNSAFGAPSFCGECETEKRANENALLKASYFMSTDRAGTHDIVFGYDTFTDITFDVNHQSGSDFRLAADNVLIDSNTGEVYPVMDPNGSGWVSVWPVFGLDRVRDTDFKTNSFFVNDRWQLNDKWSFNVGVRYDENNGVDAGGAKIADDSKVSPRLGFDYDIGGDGRTVLHGAWGRYVAAIANTRADCNVNWWCGWTGASLLGRARRSTPTPVA